MAKIGYFESMKRKKKIKDTIANIILAILVVLTLGPIVFMVLTSLMDHNAIARGKWIAPTRFSNYVEVFQKLPFGIYFRNSLIVCSIVMVVALVYCNACRLLFGKIQISGVRFLGILILATQLLPGMMFLLPLYLDFVKIKEATGIQLINSIPGLVIVYRRFSFLSVSGYQRILASIPGELEEAARIDGCNKFTAFLRVMLPLAVPGIVATAIYIS